MHKVHAGTTNDASKRGGQRPVQLGGFLLMLFCKVDLRPRHGVEDRLWRSLVDEVGQAFCVKDVDIVASDGHGIPAAVSQRKHEGLPQKPGASPQYDRTRPRGHRLSPYQRSMNSLYAPDSTLASHASLARYQSTVAARPFSKLCSGA